MQLSTQKVLVYMFTHQQISNQTLYINFNNQTATKIHTQYKKQETILQETSVPCAQSSLVKSFQANDHKIRSMHYQQRILLALKYMMDFSQTHLLSIIILEDKYSTVCLLGACHLAPRPAGVSITLRFIFGVPDDI